MFATLLLIVVLPNLPTYPSRVVYVAALGVFTIFAVRMVDGVFHHLPMQWTINTTLELAISWTLVRFVLAAIVRPHSQQVPPDHTPQRGT
jgi:NADH:ubiquinone oxidoreductase subunit 6 (subunit J)